MPNPARSMPRMRHAVIVMPARLSRDQGQDLREADEQRAGVVHVLDPADGHAEPVRQSQHEAEYQCRPGDHLDVAEDRVDVAEPEISRPGRRVASRREGEASAAGRVISGSRTARASRPASPRCPARSRRSRPAACRALMAMTMLRSCSGCPTSFDRSTKWLDELIGRNSVRPCMIARTTIGKSVTNASPRECGIRPASGEVAEWRHPITFTRPLQPFR